MPAEEDIHRLYPPDYVTHATDAGQGPSEEADRGAPSVGLRRRFKHAFKIGVRRAVFGSRERAGNGIWERCGQRVGAAMALLPALQRSAGEKLLWIRSERTGARLLDVGCGNGEYLNNMRCAGWEVTGVEPDEESVRAGRSRHGLKIYHGVLEDVYLPDNTFDVITMQHVIEHLPNPMRTLRCVHRLLRPGGRLVVVTPNVDSLARRIFSSDWVSWDPPRHLFVFSRQALRHVVTDAGFCVRQVWTPTRTARWVWQVSRRIRRDGKCTDAACLQSNRISRWGGRLLRTVENMLAPIRGVGEELVMVATKPQDRWNSQKGEVA